MYAPLGQIGFDTSAISKALVDQAVGHLKPRIPELINAAMPAAVDALKRNAPAIINAMAPSLETYATKRFYPQVIRPIIDKEIKTVEAAAKQTTKTASLVAGGAVTLIVAALLIGRRKGKAE